MRCTCTGSATCTHSLAGGRTRGKLHVYAYLYGTSAARASASAVKYPRHCSATDRNRDVTYSACACESKNSNSDMEIDVQTPSHTSIHGDDATIESTTGLDIESVHSYSSKCSVVVSSPTPTRRARGEPRQDTCTYIPRFVYQLEYPAYTSECTERVLNVRSCPGQHALLVLSTQRAHNFHYTCIYGIGLGFRSEMLVLESITNLGLVTHLLI